MPLPTGNKAIKFVLRLCPSTGLPKLGLSSPLLRRFTASEAVEHPPPKNNN